MCEGSVVDGVDTVFEVLAGWEGEINRSGMGYFRDPWGEREGVVVVGGWEREIARGWGVCPAKLKIERNVLGIGLVLKRIV